jgi:MtN3 and saliva related transmembrane protein
MSTSSFLAIAAGSWGIAMSLSPLLQVRAIVRARTSAGVSGSYLLVLLVGFVLWLSYGIAIGNPALIATNAVALLTYSATVLTVRAFRPGSDRVRLMRTGPGGGSSGRPDG